MLVENNILVYGHVNGNYDNTPFLTTIYNPNWQIDEFYHDGIRYFNSKIEKQFDKYMTITHGRDNLSKKILNLYS